MGVFWAETNGVVTIADRIEKAHRRQRVTESLSAMFMVNRPLLRLVAAELQLATIRTGVYIQGADVMAVWKDGKEIKDIGYLQAG
jgi:hypothetical protein